MPSDGSRKDPVRNYSHLENPKDTNAVTCNFCAKVTKGGIYWAKQHLVGGYRNVSACTRCPSSVREEIKEYMSKKKEEKEQMNLLLSDEINFIDGKDEDDVMEVNNRGKRVASAANVVQVVTNSESSNKYAGRMLEKEHPYLYWTPCAAYYLDLMLEDVGKIPSFSRTMQRAVELNSYIYMRPKLLNIMRNFTHKKELLRPAKTRFATCFITLSSIHKQKNNLRKMFTSEEWNRSKWAKDLKVSGPLIPVLRLVDGEKKPPMGYIYAAMDRAKEAIAKSFGGVEDKYSDIFEIIDKRWNVQFHRPLHAVG
ncbi:uncharacterized protein LOC132276330 [Cornus florida]|uniref:uncharacterized protein LOC132276330 n=1 Tax=Cornus florida TaxID=4283 RepID=UPI00289F4C16|nr:uncharacterized protein LOC132276330 [Cornus florida]